MRVGDVTAGARSAVSGASRIAISRRAVPVWLTACAVTVAAVTVITMGGLDARSQTPTALTAGDEARMPLYAVTVLDAELTHEVEDESLEADPGQTLVVVTMTLENLTDRPIGVGRAADRIESRLIAITNPLLSLPDAVADESPHAWREDGSAGPVFLQPGVPSDVTIAWIAPEAAFADGRVDLDVYDAVESAGKILLSPDQIAWRRGELAARFTVTAEDSR